MATRKKMPWDDADPTRKVGINVPFPETVMAQLDYLIEHKAIRSKSSFIRDTVSEAATKEIDRLWKVQEAIRQMDKATKKSAAKA